MDIETKLRDDCGVPRQARALLHPPSLPPKPSITMFVATWTRCHFSTHATHVLQLRAGLPVVRVERLDGMDAH